MPPQAVSDNYCKACKKKFNNAATFKNHLKSSKHVANEKKLNSVKPAKESLARPDEEQESRVEKKVERGTEMVLEIEKLKSSGSRRNNALALLMCLEMGDLVRGQTCYAALCEQDDHVDVQILCGLYEAHVELNARDDLKESVDHLELMLSQGIEMERVLLSKEGDESLLNRIRHLL
ncbi:hypothetical protein G6F60_002235 [Rhizopus arrhizus]|nr:hypothetical protein G6F61_009996 [Rhizopus arrhizus]KAG1407378.1 hypothetical protein G6F60_002235 [Rhizopus arrhizus]